MKLHFFFPAGICIGLFWIASAHLATGATNKAEVKVNTASKTVTTNKVAESIVIATSKFNIPTSTTEGRDPFFPNSARLQTSNIKVGDTSVKTPAIALQLKGISGSGNNRVALINNKTFAVGDIETVTVANGNKVEVRCVSIGEEAVTIEVHGAIRELRLPSRF